MKTMDFHRISVPMAVAALLLLSSPVALADENDQVAKLYKQGNLAKALEQADAYLALKPRDAQMRFHKGLILTEQKKTADAIRVFSSLAEEYPDLPEPYNNLAVLYAGQGQYDKAKGALEAAIRTHPSYATAHENLGDIYAKMASQAYGKALQLDKDNAAAQTKLAMIKDLFTGKPKEVQIATASPPVSSAQASNSPAVAPGKASGKAVEKAEERAEKHADEKSVAEKPVAEKPVDEKPGTEKLAAEKPAPEKSPVPDNSEEIVKVVDAWAKAWSGKNIGEYFAFYSSSFRPHGFSSRNTWEKSRRERITKPKSIHVAVTNPKVSFTDASHAKVSFRQSYHSDAIRSNTFKTLELVKTDEKWLIQQEQVGR